MSRAALITGGARRIGRELALALAARSYDIALHYHSSGAEAHEALELVREYGVRASLFQCDLADNAELLELIPRVLREFPDLELLVNNASVFQKGTIKESGPVFFDRLMTVNFKAPFFLTREFANNCRQGQVINLIDTRITRSDHSYAVYTLSKKALAELTGIAARELAPAFRVNAIAPGIILPPPDETEAALERLVRRIPMQRKGSLANVVAAMQFLLDNEFVTGQCLFIDGGESLG